SVRSSPFRTLFRPGSGEPGRTHECGPRVVDAVVTFLDRSKWSMDTRPGVRTLETYRRLTLAFGIVAAFFAGMGEANPIGLSDTRSVSRLLFVTALAFWCATDATLRNRHDVWCAQWAHMISWPLSVPNYLVETRKWRAIPLLLA